MSQPPNNKARFVTGSTMRHILMMTAAMGAGLLSLFLVDLADIFFLSLLEKPEITAAMGFAGPILFFTLSICIGSSIAMGALVARHIGADDETAARQLAMNIFIYGIVITGILSAIVWLGIFPFLEILGAKGETLANAAAYLRIILPSMPVLSVGMASGAVLRSIGDGKRSALAMFMASIANACLDPIFIFGFDMGIEGAALASVCSRFVGAAAGLHWLVRTHGFTTPFSAAVFKAQWPLYIAIALPAILTNIATPVGHAYITASIAPFGDSAMAGAAVMWRVVPVAFFALFALSGAVGPVVAQNFGAGKPDRVRQTFSDTLLFTVIYVSTATIALFLMQDRILDAFHVTGEGAELASFYFTWLAGFFLFNGGVFASNAAFNNLGHPRLSTAFNWGKATLGTIPFATAGAIIYQAKGVLIGLAMGEAIFGSVAVFVCYRIIAGIQSK